MYHKNSYLATILLGLILFACKKEDKIDPDKDPTNKSNSDTCISVMGLDTANGSAFIYNQQGQIIRMVNKNNSKLLYTSSYFEYDYYPDGKLYKIKDMPKQGNPGDYSERVIEYNSAGKISMIKEFTPDSDGSNLKYRGRRDSVIYNNGKPERVDYKTIPSVANNYQSIYHYQTFEYVDSNIVVRTYEWNNQTNQYGNIESLKYTLSSVKNPVNSLFLFDYVNLYNLKFPYLVTKVENMNTSSFATYQITANNFNYPITYTTTETTNFYYDCNH